MILKLSTCNRRSLLCTCACRAWSLNVFQFVVALLKKFPTSSNSLKNAMDQTGTLTITVRIIQVRIFEVRIFEVRIFEDALHNE